MARKSDFPAELVFVRHAESVGNVKSIAERTKMDKGSVFFELTARGRRQAEITGTWLRKHYPNPDRVLSSYYTRPMETAQLAYPDEVVRIEPLLAEIDRGIFTTMDEDEIAERFPGELRRRALMGWYHFRPMGGENWPDAERRVREFRRSVCCNYGGKRVVAFTHSHFLLLWQRVNHGWTIDATVAKFLRKEWVENASVLVYRNGEWTTATDYVVPWENHPDMERP